jgi:hypothetical protein
MRGRSEHELGGGRAHLGRGGGLLWASAIAAGRALEAEQDRWFLWLLPFAGGIIVYFALADEPGTRVAVALLVGASGFASSPSMFRSASASAARFRLRLCRGQAPHRMGAGACARPRAG